MLWPREAADTGSVRLVRVPGGRSTSPGCFSTPRKKSGGAGAGADGGSRLRAQVRKEDGVVGSAPSERCRCRRSLARTGAGPGPPRPRFKVPALPFSSVPAILGGQARDLWSLAGPGRVSVELCQQFLAVMFPLFVSGLEGADEVSAKGRADFRVRSRPAAESLFISAPTITLSDFSSQPSHPKGIWALALSSRARGGDARWPDLVMIRERGGRGGGLRSGRRPCGQSREKKVRQPRHLLAQPGSVSPWARGKPEVGTRVYFKFYLKANKEDALSFLSHAFNICILTPVVCVSGNIFPQISSIQTTQKHLSFPLRS